MSAAACRLFLSCVLPTAAIVPFWVFLRRRGGIGHENKECRLYAYFFVALDWLSARTSQGAAQTFFPCNLFSLGDHDKKPQRATTFLGCRTFCRVHFFVYKLAVFQSKKKRSIHPVFFILHAFLCLLTKTLIVCSSIADGLQKGTDEAT